MRRIKQTTSDTLHRRLAVVFMVVFVSLTAVGCFHEDPLTQTLSALDNGIASLEADSSDWRNVLEEVKRDLPDEVQSTVRTELTNLSERTIAAAGTEFRCNVDFLGNRAKEGLQEIKAHLLNVPFQRTPVFCDVIPSAIDLDLPQDRRKQIDITGYNLDAEPRLTVEVLTKDGVNVDLSDRLNRLHHYHMVLDLSPHPPEDNFELPSNSYQIVMNWGQQEMSQVPVLGRPIPACAEREETIPTVSRDYMPPWNEKPDREFFGNVDITVRVKLLPYADRIDSQIAMHAEQPNDDHTTASGTSEQFTIYPAPPGWQIVGIGPLLEEGISYHDTDWEIDDIAGGGGIVNNYLIHGDGNGPDAGLTTDVKVNYRPFPVTLRETGDCK